jgi:hypothetical protein
MVLEEGKMGKKDSDRAEGQYKKKKNDVDPQLARQQAIDEARKAGILGPQKGGAFASLRDATLATTLLGELHFPTVIVAPAPGAPASAIPKVLLATHGGAIAVANHDKLALLAVGYGPSRDSRVIVDSPASIEVHVAGDGVHVIETKEALHTIVAWKGGALDRNGVTTALAGKDLPVDVLVGEGPTARQLIDTLVAIGGKHRRLGLLDGTSEARVDKLKTAGVATDGALNANGDLDKATIRQYVRRNLNKIQYCYEKMLLAKPTLKGTVMVQFFITPNGSVASAAGSGVDPSVSSCVAEVIKGIEFPKPKGGGGVQVNYPFSFRPAR